MNYVEVPYGKISHRYFKIIIREINFRMILVLGLGIILYNIINIYYNMINHNIIDIINCLMYIIFILFMCDNF